MHCFQTAICYPQIIVILPLVIYVNWFYQTLPIRTLLLDTILDNQEIDWRANKSAIMTFIWIWHDEMECDDATKVLLRIKRKHMEFPK